MVQAQDRFAWRDWPDGCVVFDRRFGHTHALNRETAAVWRALLATPTPDRAALRQQLASPGNELTEAELDATIETAREQLVQHGLL